MRASPQYSHVGIWLVNPDGSGMVQVQDDAEEPAWGPVP
jgi:hypothetical protein